MLKLVGFIYWLLVCIVEVTEFRVLFLLKYIYHYNKKGGVVQFFTVLVRCRFNFMVVLEARVYVAVEL